MSYREGYKILKDYEYIASFNFAYSEGNLIVISNREL